MSGSVQDIYEINHRGGKIEYVYKHLKTIKRLLEQGKIKTSITIRFLRFSYNQSCEEPLKTLASEYGFNFRAIQGYGNPLAYNDREKHTSIRRTDLMPKEDTRPDMDFDAGICEMIVSHVVIDCIGDVYLCCALPNHENTRIGPYLEHDSNRILALRYKNPICKTCDWMRVAILKDERNAILN
jgi:hypothetical protein